MATSGALLAPENAEAGYVWNDKQNLGKIVII